MGLYKHFRPAMGVIHQGVIQTFFMHKTLVPVHFCPCARAETEDCKKKIFGSQKWELNTPGGYTPVGYTSGITVKRFLIVTY